MEKIPKSKKASEDAYYSESSLFKKLKELRNALATEEKVPAYIVFADSALKDMCRKLPTNITEFLDISGVGKRKTEKYGEIFCKLISEHLEENPDEEKAPSGEVSYLEKQLATYREQAVGAKYVGWTDDEMNRLRNEISQGMNMAQIASAHGRSISEISVRIKKLSSGI
jgi:ATP-dependent DNA helicase RecQ